jgi:hypothetical protein
LGALEKLARSEESIDWQLNNPGPALSQAIAKRRFIETVGEVPNNED